jgi:hypothetical protein
LAAAHYIACLAPEQRSPRRVKGFGFIGFLPLFYGNMRLELNLKMVNREIQGKS